MSENNHTHDPQKDLAEIKALGLTDRAAEDFFKAFPEATIDRWIIGYWGDTNAIGCDVRYRLPDSDTILQKEFCYTRSSDGTWSLFGSLTEKPKSVLTSKRTIQLGTFEVVSGTLVVGDPSYALADMDVLGAVLTNCFPGKWQAQVIAKCFDPSPYNLAAELQVFRDDTNDSTNLQWVKQPRYISVDCAQVGVFDKAHFQDASIVPPGTKWTFEYPEPPDAANLWYAYCCEMTCKDPEAATIPFGAVSHSGHGDGGYEFWVAHDAAGKVLGVWIIFVDDDGNG